MTIYARVKTEWGMHGMSRPEFNFKYKLPKRYTVKEWQKWYDKLFRALPATVPLISPLGSNNYIRLDNKLKLAEYWKELLRLADPYDGSGTTKQYQDYINSQYSSLTHPDRAFTNRDRNKYQKYVCSGAIVEIVGDRFWMYGQWLRSIRTLNINSLPDPSVLNLDGPFVCKPVNSTKLKVASGRLEEPFPQLDGKSVYPLFSQTGISYIAEAWIERILSPGETWPSPFVLQ